MGLKRIFVSRSAVEHNCALGESNPVFTVFDDNGDEHHSNSVLLLGPCEIRYDPEGEEGRRVWIETYEKVVLQYAPNIEGGCPSMVAV